MARLIATPLLSGLLTTGCGEDKDYGDPIDNPQAAQSATGAITNAQLLPSTVTNDAVLQGLNGLGANFNLMSGAKLQAQQDSQQRIALSYAAVDEACVVIGSDTITYADCLFANSTVSGTVTTNGANIAASIHFLFVDEDLTQTLDIDADIEVSETKIAGFVDFDSEISDDQLTIKYAFDGDFSVDLLEGCAVGGELEVHGVVRASGRKQSVWTKAEYGPTCADVIVR